MTLEGMIANYEDLQRLRKLEKEGHFKPGFANQARDRVLGYLGRIAALASVFSFIPYCGPTVTSSVAQASACVPNDSMGVRVQLLTDRYRCRDRPGF